MDLSVLKKEIKLYESYLTQSSLLINIYSSCLSSQSLKRAPRGPKLFQRAIINSPQQLLALGISCAEFKRLFRVSPIGYFKLYDLLNSHYLLLHNFNQKGPGRPPTPIDTRLGLSLFFLGHTVDYVACANFFGVASSTAWDFIEEFVDIILKLEQEFIKLPELNDIPSLVNGMCAFTELKGAVACLDGCHIPIRLPANADSQSYYCFKSFYSSLIVVLCDYKYRILGISVGHSGNSSDSTIVNIY